MSVVWFNGQFVEDMLSLNPADRGLMLGDGLFETIAIAGGNAIWLKEHMARMSASARALGIDFDEALALVSIGKVLERSVAAQEVLRVTLTRGVTERGLAADGTTSSLLISLLPFDASKFPQSVSLATSTIRRNETAPSSRHKTLSYIDNVAAAREAVGKADDALMLNSAGHVACSTVGNVFYVKFDELVTPRDGQGILPGIARAKILEHAAFKARQDIVTLDDLYSADAVFLTNSLRLVTPVTRLDDKALGTQSVQHIKDYLKGLSP
jgi:branched-chain amino acid aminotransferase